MNPAPGFHVSMSLATQEAVAALHRQAADYDEAAAFLAAVKRAVGRLQTDPVNYGEELFDLKVIKVTVKVAADYPIAVEFGVFQEQRRVLIRAFRYLTPD